MNGFLLVIWGLIVLLLSARLLRLKNISSPFLKSKRRVIVLLLIPMLAFIILMFVVFGYSTIHFIRFSHAMCVLGLWLSTVVALICMRSRNVSPLMNALRLLFTIAPAIYLTPIFRFEDAFSTLGYVFPLILGLLLIVVFYLLVTKMLGSVPSEATLGEHRAPDVGN